METNRAEAAAKTTSPFFSSIFLSPCPSPHRTSFSGLFKKENSGSRCASPCASPGYSSDVANSSEPTSPKVTCIGQVRCRGANPAKQKKKKSSRNEVSATQCFRKDILHGLKRCGFFFRTGSSPATSRAASKQSCVEGPRSAEMQKQLSYRPDRASRNCGKSCGLQTSYQNHGLRLRNMVFEEQKDEDVASCAQDKNLDNKDEHSNFNDCTLSPSANALEMARSRSVPTTAINSMKDCAAPSKLRKVRTIKEDPTLRTEKDDDFSDLAAFLLVEGKPGLKLSLDVCKETWLPSNMDIHRRRQGNGKSKVKSEIITPADMLKMAKAISELPNWKQRPIHALILSRSKSEPGKLSAKITQVPHWPKRGKSVGSVLP
eukprot:TRINITY_DN1153_c0_g1_i1.p1 TRINITY_DN1153_c0_g1~~TRINITY_DN1153_c0_g1_i1.p1  ORF type:complete len:374 (+),score=60.52 TRINITY_DN1153_c0_g1_i1:426-1547(+)